MDRIHIGKYHREQEHIEYFNKVNGEHSGDESQGASDADMSSINSENNAVYLKRNQTLHDYTPKNSNVITIHINTAEDLQKYIQDKMK